jgi:hypothetical protein
MILRNRPFALTEREIRFTLVGAGAAPNSPWGQFDRIEREREDRGRLDGWLAIVDRDLIEWGRHPESIEDDGLEPPTPAALASASRLACLLRDNGAPLPTNVAPTVDGGIAFHYEDKDKDVFMTIEVDAAGNRELRFFHEGRLMRFSDAQPQ